MSEEQERSRLESAFLAASWWAEDPPDLMDEDRVDELALLLPGDAVVSHDGATKLHRVKWGVLRWDRLNLGNAVGAALLYAQGFDS